MDNAVGYDIKNSEYGGQEEVLASFVFDGGDGITPFAMQVILDNCSKLKDQYSNAIPIVLKLRYKNIQGAWEMPSINLNSDCLNTIKFSSTENKLQQKYEFELIGSWNKQNANRIAGTFQESVTIKILPHP
ncbi:MAG: hypothetical protein FWC15_01310 [Fibromonadales bacterium]|nr:hypothetical protein [Fibromonadales bacterium]